MSQPCAGEQAPDFTLEGDQGGTFVLSNNIGRKIALFFYPKDDTSGCTAEAVAFTAAKDQFDLLGTIIVGVSPDSLKSHAKFRKKHAIGVELVSDEARSCLQAYGVWKEKSMYGKKYMGVERSTFLIGGDGKILKSWSKVSVPGHVEEVLAAVRDLG